MAFSMFVHVLVGLMIYLPLIDNINTSFHTYVNINVGQYIALSLGMREINMGLMSDDN